MQGISGKAANFGMPENKSKYNGIEFESDLDLIVYDAFYRELDPQTGKWWEIDPEIESDMAYSSPYTSMLNDPVLKSDFLGNVPENCNCCPEAAEILMKGGSFAAGSAATMNPAGEVVATVALVGTLVVAGVWALKEIIGDAPVAPTNNSKGFSIQLSGDPFTGAVTSSNFYTKDNNKSSSDSRSNSTTKEKNLNDSKEKNIPPNQLGPSGKPKIHNVQKPNQKQAKDAARNNPRSNTSPVKHSNDKGQKTHYHATRNGKKLTGKENVHYIDRSSKKNSENEK